MNLNIPEDIEQKVREEADRLDRIDVIKAKITKKEESRKALAVRIDKFNEEISGLETQIHHIQNERGCRLSPFAPGVEEMFKLAVEQVRGKK